MPKTLFVGIDVSSQSFTYQLTQEDGERIGKVKELTNTPAGAKGLEELLSCILTQRLVRLICPACRAPLSLPPDALAAAGLAPAAWQGVPLFQGRGCPACHGTGYMARTGIFELVEVSDRFREAILARRPGGELRAAAAAAGTTFLREAALEKVRAGLTTVAEVNRVTVAE